MKSSYILLAVFAILFCSTYTQHVAPHSNSKGSVVSSSITTSVTTVTTSYTYVSQVIVRVLPVIFTTITYQETRISSVHMILKSSAKKMKLCKKGSKKFIKLVKKIKAAKRNLVDSKKKISVAKAQKKSFDSHQKSSYSC